jgi:tRNA(Ile)-lysidine synthase TilS/MesJ
MALLLALSQAGCNVRVAHINHGLRDKESDADECLS